MSEKTSRLLFDLGSVGAAIVVVALMLFYIYLNGPLSVPLYSVMGGAFVLVLAVNWWRHR